MNVNKSKIQGNKKAILSLSLILLLAMTVIIAFAQPSLAQVGVPQPEKTVGFISVAPTLVGVGQKATVNLWLFPIPTDYLYAGYFNGFTGITVMFTKPDGTTDSFKPVDGTGIYVAGETEATGSLFFLYAPDMAGTWSVSFTMPTQNITDSTGTVQYMACTSNTATFTVQTSPVNAGLLNGYPFAQLPNSNAYWSYPINSNNREWYQISGDWLGSSFQGSSIVNPTSRLWQPYGSGPNTAHIVWSIPYKAGGIIGGDYGSLSYSSAISIPNAVIMGGKVFENIPNENNFECIDLTTGQILYTASGLITGGVHLPGNPFAQSILATPGQATVVLPNSYGSSPTSYLFGSGTNTFVGGSTWNYYDPFTGALMMTIANVSASSYQLVDGTNLAYAVVGNQLVAWNMTNIIANNFLTQFYTPPGTVLTANWPDGIMWTRPLPSSSLGNGLVGGASVFAISADQSAIVVKTVNQYWGFSAKGGTSLWNLTLNYPVSQNEEMSLSGVSDFIILDPTASTFKCYSDLTGALLWTSPSFSSSPWATTWTIYLAETNDYNNFYAMFPDGTMAAYNLATGQSVWRSMAINSTEYTANALPYVTGMLMVGGNIYGYAGYSLGYQLNPIPRFAMMTCVNATTGSITWTLSGGVFPLAAANGYVIGMGINDGKLYCLGKGTTSTTVSAPDTSITAGTTVIIQGSVLDKSPASSSADLTAMFANGVPAISDANMSAWMDHLHMQNSTLINNPPECTGVPVTLTAVDPNGNTVTIGTTTSNYKGNYGFQWTPTTPGLYTIYANFAGSNSYYSSSASTYATVASAGSPSSTSSSSTSAFVSSSDLLTYLVVVAIAIIIAIAIVGALILRKK